VLDAPGSRAQPEAGDRSVLGHARRNRAASAAVAMAEGGDFIATYTSLAKSRTASTASTLAFLEFCRTTGLGVPGEIVEAVSSLTGRLGVALQIGDADYDAALESGVLAGLTTGVSC